MVPDNFETQLTKMTTNEMLNFLREKNLIRPELKCEFVIIL